MRPFSTMERMVIDAVRGSPTVAPSRTAHFLSKGRCQTPMRRAPGNSSETESEEEGATAVTRQPDSSSEGTGESSYYEESDSATEMDLITRSFKKLLFHRSLQAKSNPLPANSRTSLTYQNLAVKTPPYRS